MGRQLFQYDPIIGHRFIPGLRARVDHEGGGYLVRVNAAGFRCEHEFAAHKSPSTFRILLFGDSFTAGDGVSNKDRYGDVLERLLPGSEVFNFGLSGTGTDQQYLVYREHARDLDHDLVVLGVLVENIRRIVARYRPYATEDGKQVFLAKPYFTRSTRGDLELNNVPVPKTPVDVTGLDGVERGHLDRGGRLVWLRKMVNRLGPRIKDYTQRLTRYQPLPAYNRASDPAWLLMKAILIQWANEVRKPMIVNSIPMHHYIEETASPKAYQARFRELGEHPAVILHDPLPSFHAVPISRRRELRFSLDVHPTPECHRILAESLASRIRPLMERKGKAACQ